MDNTEGLGAAMESSYQRGRIETLEQRVADLEAQFQKLLTIVRGIEAERDHGF